MGNDRNDLDFKEKFKQALTSTIKVISEEFETFKYDKNYGDAKKFDYVKLDDLNTKSDLTKARAEADSVALKKKFSNDTTYKKNLPLNSSCKPLYAIAEKIRCECLGAKNMLGIKKNFEDNYNQIISLKNKDQLKSKEDVSVLEAFELYMLKKFHNIKMNNLSQKILEFWEKDFTHIDNHIDFLKNNLENQKNYSSKFSEILSKMEIFQNEEEEIKDNDQADEQYNSSNQNQENEGLLR